MGDLSMKLSAWQKTVVTVKAKSTQVINFTKKPNYWRITNNGNTDLYLGIANIPRTTSFEMKIPGATSRIYAEEFGRNQIMLYNDGLRDIDCIVTSFRAEFNPLILAMTGDTDLAAGAIEKIAYDGVIKGFTEPLPNGNNTIGNVGLVGEVPEGENFIGYVGDEYLSDLEISKTRIVTKLYEQTLPYGSAYSSLSSENADLKASRISFLSNDGDFNLEIKLQNTDYPGITTAMNLKPGEILEDVNVFGAIMIRNYSGENQIDKGVPFRAAIEYVDIRRLTYNINF